MPNQTELSDWLTAKIASLLNFNESDIDPSASFADLGLSSLQAVQLTGDLEETFNLTVSPTAVYEFPSVGALSAELGT